MPVFFLMDYRSQSPFATTLVATAVLAMVETMDMEVIISKGMEEVENMMPQTA
jgi:hypothetical protein